MALAEKMRVIEVIDEGEVRRVRLLVPQKGCLIPSEDFTSDWPADLLEDLARLKGDWFYDSYARFEDPNYLGKQFDIVRELYGIELAGKRILDFGCGFGASSYNMIRRGADNVVGCDLVAQNIDFARRYFAGRGLDRFVSFREGDIIPQLQPAEFDIIWLQAVVEHLLPSERRGYLPRFWEALRPGGYLLITETPNRSWPKEDHTTGGRWWLPWMEHQKVFATLRREAEYSGWTDEEFYRSGVIGSSYRELMDCLGHPPDCEEPTRAVRSYLPLLYRHAKRKSAVRKAVVTAASLTLPAAAVILRRPVHDLLPFLNHLAFRKRPAS